MSATLTHCGRCHAAFDHTFYNAADWRDCPYCETPTLVRVYPAFTAAPAPARLSAPLTDADGAGCFFHASQQAEAPCDHCGRFLCALCRITWGSQTLCPACISAGALPELRPVRTRYDRLAFSLATWPLLLPFFTLITAPVALFYVARHRRQPAGPVPVSRWRWMCAAALALFQLSSWAWLLLYGVVRLLR